MNTDSIKAIDNATDEYVAVIQKCQVDLNQAAHTLSNLNDGPSAKIARKLATLSSELTHINVKLRGVQDEVQEFYKQQREIEELIDTIGG